MGVAFRVMPEDHAFTLARRMDQGVHLQKETILSQLAEGTAWFEFVSPRNVCFASISAAFAGNRRNAATFFARVQSPPPRQGTSEALKKVEHYTVRNVAGDGRCMFRALVLGMAANKGLGVSSIDEEQEADQLRLAVKEVICSGDQESKNYEEALISITVEQSLKRYCQRISSTSFWGGESELLVLSRLCAQPIVVYIPEREAKQGSRRHGGFIPIAEYGAEYRTASSGRKARKPVRLLYSGGNHYDLLV